MQEKVNYNYAIKLVKRRIHFTIVFFLHIVRGRGGGGYTKFPFSKRGDAKIFTMS